MCLQRQRKDGILYNESSPLTVTHMANNCSHRKWALPIKGMNKSLSWYSHQEDHVGDRVLLSAVCDQSRASASQFECGPGQSSWESVLRLHRGSHRAAHWTPVEHYQVAKTLPLCMHGYLMSTEVCSSILLSGVCSHSQCSWGFCCDLANLAQSIDMQSSGPVSQKQFVKRLCMQITNGSKRQGWQMIAACKLQTYCSTSTLFYTYSIHIWAFVQMYVLW